MRPVRPLRPASLLAAALLAVATGCSGGGCGGAKGGPPPERFVAADATTAVVIPSLEAFSQQAAGLLATAATFPNGQQLLDGRAVLGARLGMDLFDPASVAGTGLEVKRGAALQLQFTAPGADPQVLAFLPVADAGRFGAFVERLARDRAGATVKGEEPGTATVVTWRAAEGGPVIVAWAVVEQTAVLGLGPAAPAQIRLALEVPKDGHLGTTAAYKTAVAALGPGQALHAFFTPGTALLAAAPQLKDGLAVALRGGRDRLSLSGVLLLGAREAAVKAASNGNSRELLGKLEPRALLVSRGDGDASSYVSQEELDKVLGQERVPPEARQLVRDALAALGSGTAFGLGLVPIADGPGVPSLRDNPLAFVRAEGLVSLKDPAKMKDVLRRAIAAVTDGKVTESGEGRWTLPVPGGEVALAVDGNRLALAAGPAGALPALLARTGSLFKGPTPASAKVLEGGTGGVLLDVGRLAAGLRAIPAAAWGEDTAASALRANVAEAAKLADRFAALSVTSELVPGAQRGELTLEVKEPTAAAK